MLLHQFRPKITHKRLSEIVTLVTPQLYVAINDITGVTENVTINQVPHNGSNGSALISISFTLSLSQFLLLPLETVTLVFFMVTGFITGVIDCVTVCSACSTKLN